MPICTVTLWSESRMSLAEKLLGKKLYLFFPNTDGFIRVAHSSPGWRDSKKDWTVFIGNYYFITSTLIKSAFTCIDLLFSTPREAYVNENHALFLRQRESYTHGTHGRSSNWNNGFLLSSYLLTISDKICRNMVRHYCIKAVSGIRRLFSLKANKRLIFERKSCKLQAVTRVVHLNSKVTFSPRTPEQKPACCTKTHAGQCCPVL